MTRQPRAVHPGVAEDYQEQEKTDPAMLRKCVKVDTVCRARFCQLGQIGAAQHIVCDVRPECHPEAAPGDRMKLRNPNRNLPELDPAHVRPTVLIRFYPPHPLKPPVRFPALNATSAPPT